MQIHIRAPMRFIVFICSSITMLSSDQSPVEAACTALVSLTPIASLVEAGNNALELFDKYKHITNEDVEEAIARIHTIIARANEEVKHLYDIAERQVLETVGLALSADCSVDSAEAQRLYTVEIPIYIKRVNNAVDGAIVNISLDVITAVHEIRQIFRQAEADIAAALANVNSDESTAQQLAQIITDAAASVERTIDRTKSKAQRHFFWANLIVQAYISLTERRVRKVMPLPVADRVKADIMESSVQIDGVERFALADVLATLEKIRNAINKLGDFLDDLEVE